MVVVRGRSGSASKKRLEVYKWVSMWNPLRMVSHEQDVPSHGTLSKDYLCVPRPISRYQNTNTQPHPLCHPSQVILPLLHLYQPLHVPRCQQPSIVMQKGQHGVRQVPTAETRRP
jgi:hypothetical protein